MSWEDISLNRKLSDDEIANASSALFNVSKELILLQHGLLDISKADDKIEVVCRVSIGEGDFPTLLEIAPLRKELLPTDEYDTVGKLCELLNAHGLVMYRGDGPWDLTLVRNVGDYQRVKLDPDLFDDENNPELKIVRYMEKLT